MSIFFSVKSQYETAIEKIIYLINIKAFWKDLLISNAKKLINIRDIQKTKRAIIHFWFNHLNSLSLKESIKNNNAIIVIEISGIAGPVKREIGSKNNRINDIPFKLNSKYVNI